GREIGDEGGGGVAGAEVAERSRGNVRAEVGELGLVGEALLRDRARSGDAGARAALGADRAVAREAPVGGHRGVAIDAELLGEAAHGWQQRTGGELAPLDEGAHARGDLRGSGAGDLRAR